ncbi:MAG: 2,3-bisphosphoglycerate-independent phosphoglycerate mutase [Candidatus Hermodarchaeia archaeon]|jgi:2,3-bisphosphoglycerate-independent phosphoglycerate mutase
MSIDYISSLLHTAESKIVLLLLDGLGGLPIKPDGPTELEAAKTPNMDKLAAEGSLGQTIPIRQGITPGSGPAHLALFGYDPLTYDVGRGALSASGVGIQVNPGDIAVRGNFCSLDEKGNITDRRAGRIPNEEALPLVEKLQAIQIPDVDINVKHVKEYRFTVVMRGQSLDDNIADTDPQRTGVPSLPVTATHPAAEKTAAYFQEWVNQAQSILSDQPKANGVTLRGFATNPALPQYKDIFGLKAGCVAVYPMYRGVAHLVGMEVIQFPGESPEEEFQTVAENWQNYDFFFVHIKKTDSMGEDGNFDGKVKVIESVDKALPDLLNLEPDVLIITGDHSTPARMKSHSWHPVPLLLWAPETCLPDTQSLFGERTCAQGGLGTILATEVMPLALAHAGRLTKYGA